MTLEGAIKTRLDGKIVRRTASCMYLEKDLGSRYEEEAETRQDGCRIE